MYLVFVLLFISQSSGECFGFRLLLLDGGVEAIEVGACFNLKLAKILPSNGVCCVFHWTYFVVGVVDDIHDSFILYFSFSCTC